MSPDLVIAFLARQRVFHTRHHRRRAGAQSAFPPDGDGARAISDCA
jgi:hypothetical protein